MYSLVRTFMAHQKSGCLTREAVEQRLAGDQRRFGGYRTRLFLGLYWEVAAEWERRLATEGAVDFEDMLVQAAGHLEAGRASSAYELVLVDELRDASQARARLVRALVSKPGRYLLAVGDDWQSINRFAGADLSGMTDFANWFGPGPQLALTTTFRCPQAVCDVASSFVSKNPQQFAKPMRSAQRWPGAPVDIVRSADPASAVADYLERLSAAIKEEEVPRGADGTVSVYVLGRYNHEAGVVPRLPPYNLDVTFLTVHRSKGLEADYVVVPGMTTGTYGFPSTITDDPVLGLAMPTPDTYEHAEERRLLYVALTRARRAVTLITDPHRMSPFVVELIKDGRVTVDGQPTGTADQQDAGRPGRTGSAAGTVRVCPGCKKGVLVRRGGRYGLFLGCSSFPHCTYTCRLEPEMPSSEDSYDRRVQPSRYSRQRGGGSTYRRWH
jgi:DNA helicase-4